jgi:hypothetical protein
MPAVTLRYFAITGRAQPLRHALADAEVAFEDVRIDVSDWPRHRGDPTFAGPFGASRGGPAATRVVHARTDFA